VNYSIGFDYPVPKLGKTFSVSLCDSANSQVRCHFAALMAAHPISNNEQS